MIFYHRIAKIIISIWIAGMTGGCASGIGINKQNYFDNNAFRPLPAKIVIDNSTRFYESSVALHKNSQAAAIAMFGIGGAITGTQTSVDLIRGKFQVGRAIEESAEALTADKDDKRVIYFHLDTFDYGAIPKALQVMMAFTARMDGATDNTRSAYKCDVKLGGGLFTPGVEKNMLREMVEAMLSHWGNRLYTDSHDQNEPPQGILYFPTPERGEFSGQQAKCAYHIFVRP